MSRAAVAAAEHEKVGAGVGEAGEKETMVVVVAGTF
jgi:hypothetical protein